MTLGRRSVLFLASFLILYFELTFIRWIPGQVRIVGYFTNFVLIACFFGMGLGLVIDRKRFDAVRFVAPAFLGLVILAVLCKGLWIYVSNEQDVFLFLAYYEGVKAKQVALFPILLLFYLAIAAAFLPLGQALASGFGEKSSLADYSTNLLGSMAGIVTFFVYSWLSLPAWSWFVLGLPLLLLLVDGRKARLASAAVAVVIVAIAWRLDRETTWSPYQKLDVAPLRVDRATGEFAEWEQPPEQVEVLGPEVGFNLRVNHDYYQRPLAQTDEVAAKYPAVDAWRKTHCIPCRLKPNLDRVLIVGAGAGNDVADALRMGAKHVDAVDIDPEIVRLGRAKHPERPYDDPRVTVHVDDARHFFHHAEPGYDAVIFALLDSHRLMGNLSSLRLDSYVFTVESFENARRLLGPDGVQVTAFTVGVYPWMRSRVYEMHRRAYDGEEPIVVHENGFDTSGVVLISGPGAAHLGMAVKPRPVDTEVAVPTDNWPFVYARGRFIPSEYLIVLAMVLLTSVLAWRTTTGQKGLPSAHFFCLGAAFLLLETKNVTTLALVFGSTWYVNSVVFFTILVMALLANALLSVRRIPMPVAYAGLALALILNWLLPLQDFAGSSLFVRLVVVGGVTSLPLFFSGMVFSESFRNAANPPAALGSNILGGVFGGALEYLSMVMGLRFLFVLIALLYAASAVALRGTRRAAG